VACWGTKAAISLKRVKIEEKLLWRRVYRKSPTLFRFFWVAAIFLLRVSPLRPPRRPFMTYFSPYSPAIVTNGIVCMRGSDAALPKLLWDFLVTVHVRHTLALMCAKNHLLIFSSFLDIWENVEWPRFFWTTLYIDKVHTDRDI